MKYLICAIIKDELRYLEEWIQYHLSIGFNDIYLFEDFGSTSHKEIADKYPQVHLNTCDNYFTIKRDYDVGWARLIRLYQKFLYNNHINGWCAFIDIDEYIVLNDGYTLDLLTEEYANETGIALFWKQFNANGRVYRAKKIMEAYTTVCKSTAHDVGWYYKSFVNLSKAKEFEDLHLIKGLVDVNYKKLDHSASIVPIYDKIQLNHYFTKSYEDWCDRFVRGDLAPNHRKFNLFFELNPNMRHLKHLKFNIQRHNLDDYYNEDLISVCMCTYNRAKFLDNTISNILNQTYTNIEFIIVDDGSTDHSKDILDKWSRKDSRVKVIYSKHDFINSRNLAFKSAHGKYVACMDSDDECSLVRLEKQYKYLLSHPDVDVVGTRTARYDRIVAYNELHDDIIKSWTPQNNELFVFGTAMIRKEILDKFKHDFFFKTFVFGGEDTVFKYCLLNYGARFANMLEDLYYYNMSTQSMTHPVNYLYNAYTCLMDSCVDLLDVLEKTKELLNCKSDVERDSLIIKYKVKHEPYIILKYKDLAKNINVYNDKTISKVINYCWFGRKEKPEEVIECIESWKKLMPDYKIIEWNEDNFNVHAFKYTEKAYQIKKFELVSDFVRTWVSYFNGGVFFNVDTYLIKSINDIVENGEFFALEKTQPQAMPSINLELGVAPYNWYIGKCLIGFLGATEPNKQVITLNSQKVIKQCGLSGKDEYQKIDGVHFYPSEYFYAKLFVTNNTRSIPRYKGSLKNDVERS